jgi:hypothetical protein
VFSRSYRKRALLCCLTLASCAAGGARAEEYPSGDDPATLAAWLRGSGVEPQQVIAITPLAVVAIVSSRPPRGASGEVTLRAQALSEASRARSGFRSWEVRLGVDCRQRRVLLGPTTGYVERTPSGPGVQFGPGESTWRTPRPDTVLENAWLAVCDKSFEPPLSARAIRAASAPAPAPSEPTPPAKATAAAASPAAPAPASPSPSPSPSPKVVKASAPTPEPGRPAGAERNSVAQVVSSTRADDSRARLATLRHRFETAFAGHDTRVQVAVVGGRTVYRGLVIGFGSRAEAVSFCQTLKQKGQDCLAR